MSTRTVVAFAAFSPARLARERTSRSTATRTARSGLSPDGLRPDVLGAVRPDVGIGRPRPGSAVEDCDRPRALPGLFASRANLRMLPR
jgi:hypothetical protein